MVWNQLRYFCTDEKWGNHKKINGALLLILDELRHEIGHPFAIHCAYDTKGHSKNSQHYTGNAIDFHIVGLDLFTAYIKIVEVLKELQVNNRVGLGVYPDWNSPGFHIDLRGTKARWSRNKGDYVAIENAFQKGGTSGS